MKNTENSHLSDKFLSTRLLSVERKVIYENDSYGLYTTKSGTCRSPMYFFKDVLDMSALNAYTFCKGIKGKDKISRRNFILQLCNKLRAPYIASRCGITFTMTPTNDLRITKQRNEKIQKQSQNKL